jgi:hypothetical protein
MKTEGAGHEREEENSKISLRLKANFVIYGAGDWKQHKSK